MSPDTPGLAIAIPTRNRHVQLAKALDALAVVDLTGVTEILIVDQSSTPFNTSPWIDRFAAPLRLLHLEVPGLCRARNAALQAVGAEVVLFLDDDVEPQPSLVQAHRRVYRERPRALGVAGREILPRGCKAGPVRRVARKLLLGAVRRYAARRRMYRAYLDEDGYPVGLVLRSGFFVCDFSRARRVKVMTPRGCNMSFRRDPLLAVGGFDEGFIGIARREESDASLRLCAASPDGEIWFEPDAALVHLMTPTGGCRTDTASSTQHQLLLCEMRFARRHVPARLRPLFVARLVLQNAEAFARDPGLWRFLLRGRTQEMEASATPAAASQARRM